MIDYIYRSRLLTAALILVGISILSALSYFIVSNHDRKLEISLTTETKVINQVIIVNKLQVIDTPFINNLVPYSSYAKYKPYFSVYKRELVFILPKNKKRAALPEDIVATTLKTLNRFSDVILNDKYICVFFNSKDVNRIKKSGFTRSDADHFIRVFMKNRTRFKKCSL